MGAGYKSSGQAGTGVMSGEVDFLFSNVASSITQIRAGKLRAIATTGPKRSPVAPGACPGVFQSGVPTLNESAVPGFIVSDRFITLYWNQTAPFAGGAVLAQNRGRHRLSR